MKQREKEHKKDAHLRKRKRRKEGNRKKKEHKKDAHLRKRKRRTEGKRKGQKELLNKFKDLVVLSFIKN